VNNTKADSRTNGTRSASVNNVNSSTNVSASRNVNVNVEGGWDNDHHHHPVAAAAAVTATAVVIGSIVAAPPPGCVPVNVGGRCTSSAAAPVCASGVSVRRRRSAELRFELGAGARDAVPSRHAAAVPTVFAAVVPALRGRLGGRDSLRCWVGAARRRTSSALGACASQRQAAGAVCTAAWRNEPVATAQRRLRARGLSEDARARRCAKHRGATRVLSVHLGSRPRTRAPFLVLPNAPLGRSHSAPTPECPRECA